MIFVHLLNDRSGSPVMLASIIEAIAGNNDLLIVADGEGVLEETHLEKRHFRYRRFNSRWLTLASFILSQLSLFFLLLRVTKSRPLDETLYINTALPFGAAIFGLLTSRPVVYHLHEISITPYRLQRFLWWVVKKSATEVRYVSQYHAAAIAIDHPNSKVIYNALPPALAKVAQTTDRKRISGEFRVLMLATVRDYKGIPEFLELAGWLSRSPEFSMTLVTNDEVETVSSYLDEYPNLPPNLTLIPRVSDVAPLYKDADLVVNFSRVDQWVETFGLTLLEAMTFGIPVIAPPEGGPVELLGDDLSRYLVRARDMSTLVALIKELYQNEELYFDLSSRCRKRAAQFSWEQFVHDLTIS